MILATGLADIVAGVVIAVITISGAWYGLSYVRRQDKAKADAVLEVSSDARIVDLIQKLQESQQHNIDRANDEIDQLREQFKQEITKWRADKNRLDHVVLDLQAELEACRKQAGEPVTLSP